MAGPLAPERTPDTTVDEEFDLDRPWVTIVWNDPVNLMTIVSSGPRERMEHDTSRLHAYGLWATYQRDS